MRAHLVHLLADLVDLDEFFGRDQPLPDHRAIDDARCADRWRAESAIAGRTRMRPIAIRPQACFTSASAHRFECADVEIEEDVLRVDWPIGLSSELGIESRYLAELRF